MCGTHENIIGDFAKWDAQVDDIILCATALRKVADVDDPTREGFSLGELRQRKNTLTIRLGVYHSSIPQMPVFTHICHMSS